jgi:hypothetical protein
VNLIQAGWLGDILDGSDFSDAPESTDALVPPVLARSSATLAVEGGLRGK